MPYKNGYFYINSDDPLVLPLPTKSISCLLVSDHHVNSIFDIKNIESYVASLYWIDLRNVKEIHDLSDFSRFVSLSTLVIDDCGLESLEGLERLVNCSSIKVDNNGIELSENVDHVEALWDARGKKSRGIGTLGIGGNFILGKKIYKYNSMPVPKTWYYIKEWIGRRSLQD